MVKIPLGGIVNIIFDRNVMETEIKLIQDETIKEWVRETLQNVPEYFFEGPASSTGRYHPLCTIRKGGIVIHTKRVVYMANRLCEGWNIAGRNRDILISACILHDIAKVGKGNSSYEDYLNHPINAEKYFAKDKWPEKDDITFEQIRECVRYHMGCWSPSSIKKPLSQYKPLELATYTCDYLAATRDLALPADGIDEYAYKSGNLEPIK